MKLAWFGLLLALSFCPAALAQTNFGIPEDRLPEPTTADDIVKTNPIKLSISADVLSSDLPTVSGPYGIDEAVKIGLKNNLSLKQSEQTLNSSKFLAKAALGRFGPSASFNTFYSTSSLNQMLFFPNDTTVASSPMQPIVKGTSLSLIFAGTQPLLTGGRITGMYKAAKAREKQSSAAYAADMNSTALKIRENYWEAAWFEAKLRVDTDYVKTKEWSTANMKARFTEGKAPRADYLRDEAELSRARAQVNEDYKDYNVALVKLKTSMGANYSSMLSLKDSLEFVEIFGDLNSFLVSAANNRQEIKQAESRVAELKAQRTVARSKYAPQVNAYGLGSNITGSSPDGKAEGRWGGVIGVVGGVTLFDSGVRRNELRSASTAVRQTEIALQAMKQQVAEEVSIAWINLDLERKNVELAKTEVASAAEDQRILHTRYLVGKAISLEDFDASVKLLQARLNLLQAVYKYRLSQARLKFASGSN